MSLQPTTALLQCNTPDHPKQAYSQPLPPVPHTLMIPAALSLTRCVLSAGALSALLRAAWDCPLRKLECSSTDFPRATWPLLQVTLTVCKQEEHTCQHTCMLGWHHNLLCSCWLYASQADISYCLHLMLGIAERHIASCCNNARRS